MSISAKFGRRLAMKRSKSVVARAASTAVATYSKKRRFLDWVTFV